MPEIIPELVQEAVDELSEIARRARAKKKAGKNHHLKSRELFYINILIEYAKAGLRGEDLWD